MFGTNSTMSLLVWPWPHNNQNLKPASVCKPIPRNEPNDCWPWKNLFGDFIDVNRLLKPATNSLLTVCLLEPLRQLMRLIFMIAPVDTSGRVCLAKWPFWFLEPNECLMCSFGDSRSVDRVWNQRVIYWRICVWWVECCIYCDWICSNHHWPICLFVFCKFYLINLSEL